MKRIGTMVFLLMAAAGVASGQMAAPTSDVLGAHLNYGRGCAACHTPHSGSAGNGMQRVGNAGAGTTALWGEDASGLYGKTIVTGGGAFVETLPTSMTAGTPDVGGMLTCLSCHDGNYASNSMMQNRVYEAVPATYGSHNTIPTLLGTGATGTGNYLNEHPMGLNAKVSCGGSMGWDCTDVNGQINMTGSASSQFVRNYGFYMKMGVYNNRAVVVCTTCHDPHSMNVVKVAKGATSGLPPGTYTTMFFLRAPYNPNDTNAQSNQTSQFCRQCHADKSNEMNGSATGTIF